MADSDLILSIDTSDRELGVDLTSRGECLGREILEQPRIHASMLVPTVLDLLSAADRTFSDLAAVAVSKGPGSYTGLRIGVSSAKGLAFALGIPLIGIETMRAMAVVQAAAGETQTYLTTLSSRRNEIYAQVWSLHEIVRPLSDVASVSMEDLPAFLSETGKRAFAVSGSGSPDVVAAFASLKEFSVVPSERTASIVEGVAVLAAERFTRQEFDDVATFEPFYLKDFVAKKGASPFAAARKR
ncbi:MAG: tRNA (adenosine(37)-N6)-threonylcarbamoyltransferase complex dimerization subunit type 1 TsaB [Rhodothermales bacterium]